MSFYRKNKSYISNMSKSNFQQQQQKLRKATLQNNIGALMLMKGSSISSATERFHDAIHASSNTSSNTSSSSSEKLSLFQIMESLTTHKASATTTTTTTDDTIATDTDSVTKPNGGDMHVQGLMWFHNKLQREVIKGTNNHNHHHHQQQHSHHLSLSSSSSFYDNNNNNNDYDPNDNEEGEDMFLYQYQLNENIPLGLEYIHEPITLSNSCETDLHIATCINLALCIWSTATTATATCDSYQHHHHQRMKNQRDRISQTLKVLQLALNYSQYCTYKVHNNSKEENDNNAPDDDGDHNDKNQCCRECHTRQLLQSQQQSQQSNSYSNILLTPTTPTRHNNNPNNNNNIDIISNNDEKGASTKTSKSTFLSSCCPNPLLLIIVHNNIGVLKFIQNEFKEAFYHFNQARDLLLLEYEKVNNLNDDDHDHDKDRITCSGVRNNTNNSHTIPTRTQLLMSTKHKYIPTSPTTTTNRTNDDDNNDDENPLFPCIEYLHLTTLLNLTRTSIRMNDMLEHSKLSCDELQEYITSITTTCTKTKTTTVSSTLLSSSSNALCTSLNSSSFHLNSQHQLLSSSSYFNHHQNHRIKWLISISTTYISGLLQQRLEHYTNAIEDYNKCLSITRKLTSHDHIYVATVLEKKGKVLFDQRKVQNAMLSYLASLRIYQHHRKVVKAKHVNIYRLEQSRVLYLIGRTLHDREEYADALNMYEKALNLRMEEEEEHEEEERQLGQEQGRRRQRQGSSECIDDFGCTNNDQRREKEKRSRMVESIQMMCNIGRIHQIMGDLQLSLQVNLRIVDMASKMVGAVTAVLHLIRGRKTEGYEQEQQQTQDTESTTSTTLHPFLRNRLIVLGNVYVEMGRLEDAMQVFATVARASGGTDWMVGHLRPEVEDIDTNAFAVRAAERLGELGARSLCPHAAAA